MGSHLLFHRGHQGPCPCLPEGAAFSLALRGHLGHSSGLSISGFFATLLGFIGLLCQDHSSHFLELCEFSMLLVRQRPPPFFLKPNLLGPPWGPPVFILILGPTGKSLEVSGIFVRMSQVYALLWRGADTQQV